ncbi:hypothetical protein H9Y04_44660 [Streptomyces sp. TRM66268-LWL]|uniref:Uncharacterized protein n=1 Tax=Streptomyces polyasparticus TaxID=2767826 RepID=A0ABR7SVQ1_9ACTN|nr:hypothetical protein [Streptomyces polyasparticus]MBC9719599.1 hypothetical protein [Streptomyces polyasparticus]
MTKRIRRAEAEENAESRSAAGSGSAKGESAELELTAGAERRIPRRGPGYDCNDRPAHHVLPAIPGTESDPVTCTA